MQSRQRILHFYHVIMECSAPMYKISLGCLAKRRITALHDNLLLDFGLLFALQLASLHHRHGLITVITATLSEAFSADSTHTQHTQAHNIHVLGPRSQTLSAWHRRGLASTAGRDWTGTRWSRNTEVVRSPEALRNPARLDRHGAVMVDVFSKLC